MMKNGQKLGRSGDHINVEESLVIKTCNTNQARFRKNIAKQLQFSNPFIRSVPIYKEGILNNQRFITMPLYHCDNSMVWISRTDKNGIDRLIELVVGYFKYAIENSQIQSFDNNIWFDKLMEVKNILFNDKQIIDIINKIVDIKFNQPFYYGASHGDLTLTNLLISEDNDQIEINAIDFLDVFVESPLLDICKFRQDTRHLWTLNIINNTDTIDVNRVKLLLKYIDDKINEFIMIDPILSEYYLPFQILNLLRILPYNKEDKKIYNYLYEEITRLVNEFDTNNALCR